MLSQAAHVYRDVHVFLLFASQVKFNVDYLGQLYRYESGEASAVEDCAFVPPGQGVF